MYQMRRLVVGVACLIGFLGVHASPARALIDPSQPTVARAVELSASVYTAAEGSDSAAIAVLLPAGLAADEVVVELALFNQSVFLPAYPSDEDDRTLLAWVNEAVLAGQEPSVRLWTFAEGKWTPSAVVSVGYSDKKAPPKGNVPDPLPVPKPVPDAPTPSHPKLPPYGQVPAPKPSDKPPTLGILEIIW